LADENPGEPHHFAAYASEFLNAQQALPTPPALRAENEFRDTIAH